MLQIRRSHERGHADHGWLNSYHTFSFADYRDPKQMGFRSLRVINEDRVAAGQGFGTHAHRDMEIVSYVLEGALEHKDSMGNGQTLKPGEFQRITAGTGITHSEFNPSPENATHFYQIWILPERKGIEPSYEQKAFDPGDRVNRWQLVASPDAKQGSLLIHQDASIFLADLTSHNSLDYHLLPNRHAWVQVLRGTLNINNEPLHQGDAVAISDHDTLRFQSPDSAEIMLFDLA
jgi:quercetin 2,3-dioxygenase